MTPGPRGPRRRLVAAGLAVTIAACVGPAAGRADTPGSGQPVAPAAGQPVTPDSGQPGQDGRSPPTREQIKALLRTEITPTGAAAAITAVLEADGYSLTFTALTAGLAAVDWASVPPGAGAYAAARAKTLLLARGSLAFSGAGTGQLFMRLTRTGRSLLRSEATSHVRFLAVSAKATFTPAGGAQPISVVVRQKPGVAGATPRCFGAASHNPRRRCANPRLGVTVTPTPGEALITPNAPCAPASLTGLLIPCAFGAPLTDANPEVALVGDSHAETWRGAMTVVADALGWNAVSLTRSSCSYTDAVPTLSPLLAASCLDWRAGVVAWFQANPRVTTVFVADNDLGAAVGTPGRGDLANQVTGYLDAWRALPRSVTRIIVLRDSPFPGIGTAGCVEAALRRHAPAGVACALRRTSAVFPDPAALAAYRDAPRARVVDLTGFFCGPKVCPPVIGGVLVYKDASHMTNLFSTTLGPFLLSRVRRLLGLPGA